MESPNKLMAKQIGRESYSKFQYIFLRQSYKSVRNEFLVLSRCVQFEVLTVVVMKSSFIWDLLELSLL